MRKEKEKTYTVDEALRRIYGDSYSNTQLNMGYGSRSLLEGTSYKPNNSLTWDCNRIMQMERSEPLLRRCVEYKASSILGGIDISSKDITSDEIKKIQVELDKLYRPLYDFIYQAIFFGGGACMFIFKGDFNPENESRLLEPLDISKVKKGDFLGLKPLERWFSCIPDTTILIDTLGESTGIYEPELLGEPLYFNVSFGGSKKYRVHRSRLLIYNTGHLPRLQKQIEQYWSVSFVELIYDALNRYNTAINAVINMFIINNSRIIYIDESTDTAMLTDKSIDAMKAKLKLMSAGLSFSNILFLSKDDKYEVQSTNLTNVAEILKNIRLDFCASVPIPISQLFDDGVNDTQTTENAHKNIKDIQTYSANGYYLKLIPIIYQNLYGKKCPDFDISFNPIRKTNDKEQADITQKMTSSVVEVFKSGAMNIETFVRALSEICNNPSDIYNNYDEKFLKENGQLTYNDIQVRLASALNKKSDTAIKEKEGGTRTATQNLPKIEGDKMK